MMRYLSVCSGIEAASVAWHPLGWKPVAFSEIEPFPSAVLAHHYPDTPNWGDMSKFQEWPDAAIDVLVGGTPCQAFSVAGLRKGLADPRGNLTLTYLAIAASYRPKWLVWENVPGVLSDRTGAFGSLLGGLAELGYGWAYRVLDAQYFGLAQRRRRVFVVGSLGGWASAAAVLFERESLQRYPAPRREARQVAPTIPARSTGGGGLGTDWDCDGGVVQVCPTLRAGGNSAGGDRPPGTDVDTVESLICTAMAFDTTQITSPANYSSPKSGDPCHPLAAGAHPPAVAFDWKMGEKARSIALNVEQSPTLGTQSDRYAVAFQSSQSGVRTGDAHATPDSNNGSRRHNGVVAGMQVRRLTPVECSRLQGFPDDYLELTYADADEAHSAQVLHELWQEAGTTTVEKQGWRTGISAALLAPEILLAGVYGGWLSWELAERCASARGALPGENYCYEGFMLALREAGKARRSPYKRESFGQLARKLGSGLSILPLESAQARKVLRSSRLWPEAQAKWPLRYALAKGKAREALGRMNPDGPRYKALGNSMAVPCMAWIGQRIAMVEQLKEEISNG